MLQLYRMCVASLALFATFASAGVLLYDASNNTLPTNQNWHYLTNPTTGSLATQSVSGGILTLDTTSRRSDAAGYFAILHPLVGELDRHQGFTIRFDAQILAETHASIHRAGFSFIVTTSDALGLELGFWADRIWAQDDSPLFTQAEGVSYAVDTALTRYDLQIQGAGYTLFADASPILVGALRDYSTFGLPYTMPNFLFFGDNTSSAKATVQISRVELTSAPEISPLVIVSLTALTLAIRLRWSR